MARRRPSFMLALCCMFIPPVYFIVRKRYAAAVVNGIIWLAAFPSLIILPLGIGLWFIAAGWAGWNMGHDSTEYQAQKIGEAVASKNLSSVNTVSIHKKATTGYQFCGQCRAKVSQEDTFCSECGHSLK